MDSAMNQSLRGGELGKYKHFEGQRKTIIRAFSNKHLTMLQVAHMTGIERANICRRVAELRETDNIYLVRKGLCPITKHRAGFYTTDREQYLQSLKPQRND